MLDEERSFEEGDLLKEQNFTKNFRYLKFNGGTEPYKAVLGAGDSLT